MKNSPDGKYHRFDITDIRGDWALRDSGHTIVAYTNNCCGLMKWVWQHANATGWASMQIYVSQHDHRGTSISDAECVTRSIKKAGGPENSFCFEAS